MKCRTARVAIAVVEVAAEIAMTIAIAGVVHLATTGAEVDAIDQEAAAVIAAADPRPGVNVIKHF